MGNISENIRAKRDEILANKDNETGKSKARTLQMQATDALLNGISSRAWAKYMMNYMTNEAQLTRLIGEDANFMDNTPYAKETLVYIVANATCGTTTVDGTTGGIVEGGTMRNLDPDMIGFLDAGVEDPVPNN